MLSEPDAELEALIESFYIHECMKLAPHVLRARDDVLRRPAPSSLAPRVGKDQCRRSPTSFRPDRATVFAQSASMWGSCSVCIRHTDGEMGFAPKEITSPVANIPIANR